MKKITLFPLLLILTCCSKSNGDIKEINYYRQDCIVEVQGLFKDVDRKLILKFNNQLADSLDSFRSNNSSGVPPFAYVIGETSQSSALYYLQFTKECDDRLRFAEDVFAELWDTTNAKYLVSNATIKPSTATIDVEGPWIDKSENFK